MAVAQYATTQAIANARWQSQQRLVSTTFNPWQGCKLPCGMQGLVCCGNFWGCRCCNQIAKQSFNNTLCNCRANRVNLQTNTNQSTLRQLSKQQGVLSWANCLTVLARWQRWQKEACCNVQTFPFVQNLVVLACKKYSKFFENFAEKCLTYFLRCSIIYRLSA